VTYSQLLSGADEGPIAMIAEAAAPDIGKPKAKVFISYSSKDTAFADRLEAALTARGFEVAGSDTVVFVLSPDPIASEGREVAFAASLSGGLAPMVCRAGSDDAVPDALARLDVALSDDDARFAASVDQLAEALDVDIAWIRERAEIGEQTRRWASAGRPFGLLLRSPVLEQAERWIATHPRGAPAPTEDIQTFIRHSREAMTRRRNILTGSLAVGLVVAFGLAGLAYWQRGIAVEQSAIAQRNLAQTMAEIARLKARVQELEKN
jgi:hypothetical protein